MPSPNLTDRTGQLEQSTAILTARCDNLFRGIEQHESSLVELRDVTTRLDKVAEILTRDLERLEKKLDLSEGRRWDIVKLLLGFVLGVVTTGIGLIASRLPGK